MAQHAEPRRHPADAPAPLHEAAHATTPSTSTSPCATLPPLCYPRLRELFVEYASLGGQGRQRLEELDSARWYKLCKVGECVSVCLWVALVALLAAL